MMELRELSRRELKTKKVNPLEFSGTMKAETWGTPHAQPQKAAVLCIHKRQEIAGSTGRTLVTEKLSHSDVLANS